LDHVWCPLKEPARRIINIANNTMKTDRILLSHGSGSKASHELISELFLPAFSNPSLDQLNDQAILELNGLRIAYTTDSYVVDPIFFPGGDIGKLAICGTVNDLAMCGAVPLYLSAGFIIEEGFAIDDLRKVIRSMQRVSREAGVKIVTGDTKVVNKGHADRLFINTSGIGLVGKDINISGNNGKVGDKVIISGCIGDHGIAVLSKREGLEFDSPIISDCAPLNQLVRDMLTVTKNIHCLRDPTRGGLATTLNELAQQSRIGIVIEENKIPVKEPVKGACELLGYDPLYVANEGKLVAIIPAEYAPEMLQKMRQNKYGQEAEIIGEVVAEPRRVLLKTTIGGTRIVDMLAGELLPRIC
jgi:hydrogenase expression/formation protein HypE